MYKITLMFFVLSLGFVNCAGYRETGTHECVTTLEEQPECPDRDLFESDFEYNSSLTQDIIQKCKIKDVSRSDISITIRKARVSEIQTEVFNE